MTDTSIHWCFTKSSLTLLLMRLSPQGSTGQALRQANYHRVLCGNGSANQMCTEEFALFESFVGFQSIRICMADYVIKLAYGKLVF